MNLLQRKIDWLFMSIALLFIVLAIIGTLRAYTPVPFKDMWDDYINFYLQVSHGNWYAWWAQYNEHRLLLSRLLFWVDLSWFNGTGKFLFVMTYLLVGLINLLFYLFARAQGLGSLRFIQFFLIAWLFSWSQSTNFTWAFQSQMFFAQLLPLAAIYLLYRAAGDNQQFSINFIFSALIGFVAIGSMGSAILALPLMTCYALVARLGCKRIVTLALLSLLAWGLFFYGYHPSYNYGNTWMQGLHASVFNLIGYVILFFGGPFFHLTINLYHPINPLMITWGYHIGMLTGIFFLFSVVLFTWSLLTAARRCPWSLALLTFIFYMLATALAICVSRISFGPPQAVSSRYMTASLMAWAALMLLYVPYLKRRFSAAVWKVAVPLLVLLVIMLSNQLQALNSQRSVVFETKVAALALALGIQDLTQQAYINNELITPAQLMTIASRASAKPISIFSIAPYREAKQQLGRHVDLPENPTTACPTIQFAKQVRVKGGKNYLRVNGKILTKSNQTLPSSFELVNKRNRVVGIVLTGYSRQLDKKITPFKGYLFANQRGDSLLLVGGGLHCSVVNK